MTVSFCNVSHVDDDVVDDGVVASRQSIKRCILYVPHRTIPYPIVPHPIIFTAPLVGIVDGGVVDDVVVASRRCVTEW